MEKLLEEALLFDFYGELLTEHQKTIYEDFVLNDLSLSEIADERGISRQGVYDIVKRCRRQLQSYEDKLHLIRQFMLTRKQLEEIHDKAVLLISHYADQSWTKEEIMTCIESISQISGKVVDEL